MATQGSPLANVLKRSLTISSTMGETFGWRESALELNKKYTELLSLHDELDKQDKTSWPENSEQNFQTLIKEMKKLEEATVGTDDAARKKYTESVNALIKRAGQISTVIKSAKEAAEQKKKLQDAEATERKNLASSYETALKTLKTAQNYVAENDVAGNQDFSQLKQWVTWSQSATPSVKQMKAIINGTNEIKKVVEGWSQKKDQIKKEEEERIKREEQNKKTQQAKQQEDDERRKKAEAERQQKLGPARKALADALSDAEDELKELNTLLTSLTAHEKVFAADKKYSAFLTQVKDLRKRMANESRKNLGATTPTLDDVIDTIKAHQAGIDKLSSKQLEEVTREAAALMKNIGLVEQARTQADGYADEVDVLDPANITRPAANTKATGYVFNDDVATAEKNKKDMIGILAGVRKGRSSPNGKAKHIHVGGTTFNVIFDSAGPGGAIRVLGFVDGHMDRRMPPPVRAEAANVESRASSPISSFTEVEVDIKDKTFTVL